MKAFCVHKEHTRRPVFTYRTAFIVSEPHNKKSESAICKGGTVYKVSTIKNTKSQRNNKQGFLHRNNSP
jgi:hypothetical protein